MPLQPSINITIVADDFVLNQDSVLTGKSLIELLSGKYDLNGVFDYGVGLWRNELDTHIEAGHCYVTGITRMTLKEYFSQVIPSNIFLALFCINIVVAGLIPLFLNNNFFEIIMDTLRAFVGVAMLQKPKTSVRRIIFILIVIWFMALNSYVQSQLSSFITVMPMRQIQIEKAEDLISYGFKVQATHYSRQYFRSSVLYDQIQVIDDIHDCLNSIKHNKRLACIEDCTFLRFIFNVTSKHRISKDAQVRRNYVYFFSDDNPLLRRIRGIYSRLYENGIVQFLDNTERFKIQKKFIIRKNEVKDITFDVIKPAFYLLLIGLINAGLLFVMELFFNVIPHGKKYLVGAAENTWLQIKTAKKSTANG